MQVETQLIIDKENAFIKAGEQDVGGVSLNLGCGPRTFPGWANIDKYHKSEQVLNFDLMSLPYAENSVSRIFSAHSLEHLGIRQSILALEEWHRVLKVGGELMLSVPDMTTVLKWLLAPEFQKNPRNYRWAMYCLFGFQTATGNTDYLSNHYPDDLGQHHRTGFTESSLKDDLERIGFNIKEQYTYDGWGTPSLLTFAIKTPVFPTPLS